MSDDELERLPDVRHVERIGNQVVVTGTGNVVQAVTSFLARRGIVAHELRVEQASLDDAYLAITARPTRALKEIA